MIDFNVSRDETIIILAIVKRARSINPDLDPVALNMDITATHRNGNPLLLADLLVADNFNFTHDVGGIMNHIDRETGKLTDCFSPRYTERAMGEATP